MNSVEAVILDSLRATLARYATKTVWIAYSGGMDSHVLLDAAVTLQHELQKQLRVIHIHHGLHSLADNWARHCQQICVTLQVPCEVIRVQVNTQRGESIEAQARLARYAALQTCVGKDDVLLTAQHQNDQAETLLLQLFRGAGVAGLAAMPAVSQLGLGWLVRPFLNISQQQLREYAQQKNLQWIEDDSNQNTRFDRNFLRHEIMPHLQSRWQQIHAVLSRTAQHQAEAQDLLTELGNEDLTHCLSKQFSNAISLMELNQLSAARQRNAVRTWLKQCHLSMPSTQQLHAILDTMQHAPQDRQPRIAWADGEVRRYQACLFALSALPPVADFPAMTWDVRQNLSLPFGKLRAKSTLGKGVRLPESATVQIRWRRGGERCRWRGHQREIKKLLQQAHIPPWLRPFLPLVYVENILIAIPNLLICDDFSVGSHEVGWEIFWEGADGLSLIPISKLNIEKNVSLKINNCR